MKFQSISEIKASIMLGENKVSIGRLAHAQGKIYFQYDTTWLNGGLELSPIKLPLDSGLRSFDPHLFDGLPGLFYDSLPDGWGRLLLDRTLRKQGILANELNPLDRLAHVGNKGMGALIYEPIHECDDNEVKLDLNQLAAHSQQVLSGGAEDVLQELLMLNGSSAGARPKAMISVDKSKEKILFNADFKNTDYQAWLVKFSNIQDGTDAGAIEYVYALMAKKAGIEMTEAHLFFANKCAGYFATKRFDRNDGQRIHTHSVCGLLHSDFHMPVLDYQDLLALTNILTRDIREVEKMYQLAVFNVLAHNRDDHAKNFSFLMDSKGQWQLSPAYDLTFSSGPRGEQSTLVMGEGKNPTINHLIKLGLDAKIKQKRIHEIIEQTKDALSHWKPLAKQHNVTQPNIELIDNKIKSILK